MVTKPTTNYNQRAGRKAAERILVNRGLKPSPTLLNLASRFRKIELYFAALQHIGDVLVFVSNNRAKKKSLLPRKQKRNYDGINIKKYKSNFKFFEQYE